MKTLTLSLFSLFALVSTSAVGQPSDPGVQTQVLRVYNITSTTAVVEGVCSRTGGFISQSFGPCNRVEFEYGTSLPLTQKSTEVIQWLPEDLGRSTANLTSLQPGMRVYIRMTTDDNESVVVSEMKSFSTAKTDVPSASIYVTLWDEECFKSRACVNVFWDSNSSPSTSVFVGVSGSAEYELIGTADTCSLCRIPVDKNKTYRYVIYTARTPGKPSRPAGTLLAEFTYKIP